ncbi:MAG: hypothetical protein RL094_659 [Candidatus Parcubacteria bacterium]|jgi:uncharacterized RDD family membrane protein YckC
MEPTGTPIEAEVVGASVVEYAGFWKRVGAALIDGFLIGVVGLLIQVVVAGPTSFTLVQESTALENLLSVIVFLGYFTWMESGSHQATIGKQALKIKVTGLNGERITPQRALVRTVSKYLSGFILLIGYLMVLFTEKKQALHDIIAKTVVVRK